MDAEREDHYNKNLLECIIVQTLAKKSPENDVF